MRTSSLGLAIGLLVLGGCSQPPKNLVSGSKRSLESSILCEILAQHVQHKLGTTVDRRLGIQGSMMAHQSLLSGEIDFYTEDSGTAYYSIFRLPVNKDLDILNSRVALEYQNTKIRWMAPLGYSSTFVAAASKEKVKASTLSELAETGKMPPLSCSLEFSSRFDGFPVLTTGYRLSSPGPGRLVDPNLVADQITNNLAHMAVVASTDPLLLNSKVKTLEDDRKLFTGYPVAILVKERTLAANPQLEAVLKQLEGKLPLETMRKLTSEVKTQGKTAAAVAAAFLQQAGLK